MKPGTIVKYTSPLDLDEERIRFRVLEAHPYAFPPRIMVEVLNSDWAIAPIEILAPEDVCAC